MPEFQKFNDGIADIYSVENVSEKGDRPKEVLKLKYRLRFSRRTIGVKRYYEAMQAQVRLSNLIRVPVRNDISPQDVAVISGRQYRIEQVQHIGDTLPPTTLLSLSRLEADYDLETIQRSSSNRN